MPEKKLAERLREAIRLHGHSIRTEKATLHWYERFVRFHKLRHPASMVAAELVAFLTHLAVKENVAASTQNRALSAVLIALLQGASPRPGAHSRPASPKAQTLSASSAALIWTRASDKERSDKSPNGTEISRCAPRSEGAVG